MVQAQSVYRSIRLYDIRAVWPASGAPIFRAKDQLFCCGLNSYDFSDGTCYNITHGSNAPFPVDQGSVIFDRPSGSTSPNNPTATFTSTVTLAGATRYSVTTSAATAAGTAASPPPTVHGEATVAVAVGVSLGMALLGSVAMLWRQKREAKGLREDKKTWEEKYIALLESKCDSKTERQKSENVPHHSSERLVRYELENATMREMPS